MTTDNLGWLLPAWLLGAPLLLGLYELATMQVATGTRLWRLRPPERYGRRADRPRGGPRNLRQAHLLVTSAKPC